MKQALRRMAVIGSVLALALAFSTVWANCGTSQLIANYSTGGQLNVSGVLDDGSGTGTIITKFWLQGRSELFNSGTLKDTFQIMPWENQSYYIWSDWGNDGVVGDCPPYNGRSVFLYSIENGGKGEYILMSTAMDTTTTWSWNFDSITNGNGSLGPNTEEPILIPKLEISDASMEGPGVVSVTLNWKAIENLRGFYDTDPGKNLITGVAVRYYQGVNPPVSFRSADWPLAGTVYFSEKGVDVQQTTVEVPYSDGLRTYVALSLLFDGGTPGKNGSPAFTETNFVGEPCRVLPLFPKPQAKFGEINAVKISRERLRVSWTMDEEIGVESYVVYGAHSKKSGCRKLADIASDGTSEYIAVIKAKKIRRIVIKASLNNGGEVKSGVVRVIHGAGIAVEGDEF